MEETKKDGTTVVSCTCKSEFQDKEYGKGKRLANIGKTKNTCTVCGASH